MSMEDDLRRSIAMCQQAYLAGRYAKSVGIWLEDCPHDEAWLGAEWRKGWQDGERMKPPLTSLGGWEPGFYHVRYR